MLGMAIRCQETNTGKAASAHPEILRPPVVLKFLSYKILTLTKRISIAAIFSLLVPNLVYFMCLTMPKCTQKYRNKYAYFVTSSFTIQLNFPTKHTLGVELELETHSRFECSHRNLFSGEHPIFFFFCCSLASVIILHSIKHGNHFWPSIQLYKASKRKMVTENSYRLTGGQNLQVYGNQRHGTR